MIIKIKRISMAVKKPRKRRIYAHKRWFQMHGGPASSLRLSTPGTLRFRLGDFYGYYDENCKWVDL